MFRFRIRELRENAGYKSQQAFADAFGVAQSTVASWEGGKREPNYKTTIRLSNFFGVSLDYLLGQDDKDPEVSVPDLFAAYGPATDYTPEQIAAIDAFMKVIRSQRPAKEDV